MPNDAGTGNLVAASPDRYDPNFFRSDAISPSLAAARIALVHDWLTGYRGGEKCLDVLCRRFPDAKLYTLLHAPGSLPDTIECMDIRRTWKNLWVESLEVPDQPLDKLTELKN